MTLTIKDIIYLSSFLASILSVFFWQKNQIANIKRDLKNTRQIIFGERGCLNLVDAKTCESNRNHVFIAIRRADESANKTIDKLEELSEKFVKMDKNIDKIGIILDTLLTEKKNKAADT